MLTLQLLNGYFDLAPLLKTAFFPLLENSTIHNVLLVNMVKPASGSLNPSFEHLCLRGRMPWREILFSQDSLSHLTTFFALLRAITPSLKAKYPQTTCTVAEQSLWTKLQDLSLSRPRLLSPLWKHFKPHLLLSGCVFHAV